MSDTKLNNAISQMVNKTAKMKKNEALARIDATKKAIYELSAYALTTEQNEKIKDLEILLSALVNLTHKFDTNIFSGNN